MTLSDLWGFLLGDADAIRRLAANPWALVIGALLVLSAGVARNYDSHDLQRELWRLLLPFAASTLAAALLFGVAALLVRAGASIAPLGWGILGLFWLTAPLAWLYGLPFERTLSPAQARKARRWTLAVVAVYRVGLMTRSVSVLCGCSVDEAAEIVLCFAAPMALLALAVAAAFVRAPMTGRAAGRSVKSPADDSALPEAASKVVDAMSGAVLDVESGALLDGPRPPQPPGPRFRFEWDHGAALGATLGCLAVVVLVGATLVLAKQLSKQGRRPLATPELVAVSPSPGLSGFTGLALLFWGVLAAVRQPPQRRLTRYVRGLQAGDARKMVRDLAAQSPAAFPPRWDPSLALMREVYGSRMLEAMQAAADLPSTSWVRRRFLAQLGHLIPVWLDSFELWAFADDRMSEAELRDLVRLRDLLRCLPNRAELLQPYQDYLDKLSDYTRERDPPRHAILEELRALAADGGQRDATGKDTAPQP